MLRLVLVGTILAVALIVGVFWIVIAFDDKELPKVVGSAFGAVLSAGIALLVFSFSRVRDAEKSKDELLRLEKAYWLDTRTTLPAVYDEMIYWKSRAGQETNDEKTPTRPKALDVIVEHLHSQFFDANLTSIVRISMQAQTLLMVFHDNLRIARERLTQVAPMLLEFEHKIAEPNGNRDSASILDGRTIIASPALPAEGSGTVKAIANFNDPWVRDRLIEISEMAKELADVLESSLLHGWDAMESLEAKRNWAKELTVRDDGGLPGPTPAWIGGVKGLREMRKRSAPVAVPDDIQ